MLITDILSLKLFQREDYRKLNMSEWMFIRRVLQISGDIQQQHTSSVYYGCLLHHTGFFHMNLSTAAAPEVLHSNTVTVLVVTVRNLCFTKYYVPRRLPRWTELFADCYFIALWEYFPWSPSCTWELLTWSDWLWRWMARCVCSSSSSLCI